MTYKELADRIHAIEATVEKAHEDLTALLVAVEKMEKAEEATPVAEPTPQIEPGTVITLEDVRAALTELAGVKGAATTKTLLAEYDAKKLSDVPADKYASLLTDAKAWAND